MPTRSTIADGSWNNPTTWDTGVPSPTDTAVVRHVVTLDANVVVLNLTFFSDADNEFFFPNSFEMNGFNLTVTGTLTYDDAGGIGPYFDFLATGSVLTVNNPWVIAAGTAGFRCDSTAASGGEAFTLNLPFELTAATSVSSIDQAWTLNITQFHPAANETMQFFSQTDGGTWELNTDSFVTGTNTRFFYGRAMTINTDAITIGGGRIAGVSGASDQLIIPNLSIGAGGGEGGGGGGGLIGG